MAEHRSAERRPTPSGEARIVAVCAIALSGCMMDAYLWPPDSGDTDTDTDPVDLDGDGYTIPDDCDDDNAAIGPHASDDECDGIDDNCDGAIDFHDGREACLRVDMFDQTLKADVLLVIDDAISMHDHGFVDLAAAGASYLLEPLRGWGMETHIGVITSDMTSPTGSGRLQEAYGRRYITGTNPADADSAIAWLEAAIRGDGLGVIHPRPTPKAAIEAAVFEQADLHNNGFFRPEAQLAVLLIGDQDDADADPSVAELLTALRTLKMGTGADVTFFAITQDDTVNCDGKGEYADVVLQLVSQTLGLHDSICRSEYGGFMAAAAQDIRNNSLGSVFSLSNPAVLGDDDKPIAVFVNENGGQGPRYSWAGYAFRDQWTIVFNIRPPPGSIIEVHYREDPHP